MASALERVAWESCLIEPRPNRALETYARRRMGVPNPTVRYFAPLPWLARAVIDLHPEFGLLIHLDQTTADILTLVVSQENSCRFCYAAQRALLWAQGMSEARIRRVEQDLNATAPGSRTLAAIAFARSQSRMGPAAAAAARQALRAAGTSDEEMKEIAFAVAVTDFFNRVYSILAIPSRAIERMPERLHVRLLRQLINRILQRHRSRGRPTPLPSRLDFPLAPFIAVYAGSPIAVMLGRTLAEMWASPVLTRRCKLLMFAIIARGLECGPCAAEIDAALQGEGLSRTALAEVLTHLDASELTPVERLLVPLARETIWYEPAALQRRTRALRERLSGLQLLEAVGVAGLANGLCRMNAMVMEL